MNKNKKFLILSIWLISVLCIVLSPIFSSSLCVIPFILFCIALFIFEPIDCLVLLFGIMPMAAVYKLQYDGSSFFTYCEILLIFFFFIKTNKINLNVLILILMFLIYITIFSFNNLNLPLVLKLILNILLVYFFVNNISQRASLKMIQYYTFSLTITMLLSLSMSYQKMVEPYFDDINYYTNSFEGSSEIIRLSGFFGDPNYCSVAIIIVLSMVCLLYFYKKINKSFYLFSILLIIIGLFTYSKSFLLGIFLLICLFLIFVLSRKSKLETFLISTLFIFLVFLSLNGNIKVIDMILDRLNFNDITTGRTTLNIQYMNYILDYPKVFLFGEGISVDRLYYSSNNVHNIYIESLFKLGVVGTILLMIVIFTIFRSNKDRICKLNDFMSFIPLIMFSILFYFLGGLTSFELPFYLMFIYMGLRSQNLFSNSIREVNYDKY